MNIQIAMLVAGTLLSSSASAQSIVKHVLPPGKDGSPARILESAEVPATAATLYISGQVASPIDPATVPKSIADFGNTETQTRNILAKIDTILRKRGYQMSDVVKMTIFLKADPALGKMDFAGANAGFDAYFNTMANPTTVARSTVEISGFAGPYYLVEIEAVAAKARTGSP